MHGLFELNGDLAYFQRDVEADAHIDKKDAEECADKENHPYAAPRPDGGGMQRVEQQIYEAGRDNAPKDGKQGADDALYIAPLRGIIPQFDLHSLYENEAGYIFEQGKRNKQKEHERPARERYKAGAVQKQGAETVHGQIRAIEKTGVDPLSDAEKPAEKQFDHPSADRADHK